jgi:hypothetical protein
VSRIVFAELVGALEAQIDANPLTVAPCHGIAAVPPGLHRLSVLVVGNWHNSWLAVTPDDADVVVPGDLAPPARVDDRWLAPFPGDPAGTWAALTHHLDQVDGLPSPTEPVRLLAAATAASRRRAGSAGALTNAMVVAGRAGGLLRAIESSFVEGFLTPDTGDGPAIARWRRLVALVASATVEQMVEWPELFVGLASVLEAQIAFLGAEHLDDGLVYELDFLATELIASTTPECALAGLVLEQTLFHPTSDSSGGTRHERPER